MTRLFAGTPFDIPPRCDLCGELTSDCQCTDADKKAAEEARQREAARRPPSEQTARVTLERRKGGRVVTAVTGLTAAANDLPSLLAELQTACGTGGTTKPKEDRIELQGDHAETVRQKLQAIGFRVKR